MFPVRQVLAYSIVLFFVFFFFFQGISDSVESVHLLIKNRRMSRLALYVCSYIYILPSRPRL